MDYNAAEIYTKTKAGLPDKAGWGIDISLFLYYYLCYRYLDHSLSIPQPAQRKDDK